MLASGQSMKGHWETVEVCACSKRQMSLPDNWAKTGRPIAMRGTHSRRPPTRMQMLLLLRLPTADAAAIAAAYADIVSALALTFTWSARWAGSPAVSNMVRAIVKAVCTQQQTHTQRCGMGAIFAAAVACPHSAWHQLSMPTVCAWWGCASDCQATHHGLPKASMLCVLTREWRCTHLLKPKWARAARDV
jgi:hypothetical protein